jgi:hypothetical protein
MAASPCNASDQVKATIWFSGLLITASCLKFHYQALLSQLSHRTARAKPLPMTDKTPSPLARGEVFFGAPTMDGDDIAVKSIG